ncbi:MAG: succinylglutamate desuccinylase/aspartoacylase family protein [Pirellulaceae bacterium]|nr:succinylglutamate desuccinylase/aspartoacylase family protein [Pirellulaceae bacterium]MDP7015331.1 succinylglutamate desuccinylase/aspartoacylase family protein [Pirellulaceae bacterium]
MSRSLRMAVFLCCFQAVAISLLAISTLAAEQVVSEGVLGRGETWETPWRAIDSRVEGPTVVVVAGLHGNEPAGYRAAEQIKYWPIAAGKLVVLPRVNRLGLAANTRWAPEFRNDRARRDLNRNFPTSDRDEVLTPVCQAVWKFVQEQKPEWVFDLHEGFDFHRLNSKSVGSSVIAFPAEAEFASLLCREVNADVAVDRQFDLLAKSGPVRGSLARACGERLAAKSFILETTFKSQPVSLRARQHRRMVSTAFLQIGLIDSDCTDRLAPASAPGVTRIALFDDAGANEAKVLKVIDDRPDSIVCHVGGVDMKPQVLEQFDVVVFPGGSGSKQGAAIGAKRRGHVRDFAERGGGVVGICAGAYLCSSHYTWSLDLMNAAVFNKSFEIPGKGRKSMWFRGPATDVDVEVTSRGATVLGVKGLSSVRYQNGPILSPGDDPDLPTFEPLAFFRSENGIYEPQKNTMIDTPAVVAAQYGLGRVLAISPHFESTKGREAVVRSAIEHVRRRGDQKR